MPAFFNVTIPCKTYIKKYLMSRYGNPLKASAASSFGDIILTKLADRTKTKLSKDDQNFRLKTYNDAVRIMIPWDYFYKIGKKDPDQHAIIKINLYFENQFKEDLHHYVSAAIEHGVQIQGAIEKFCDRNRIDIEVDVSYECLKKMEYRVRTAVKVAAGNDLQQSHDLTTLSNLVRRSLEGINRAQLSFF